MEVNIEDNKDGGETLPSSIEAPSKVDLNKLETKKKRRRGKSKRKVMKPYVKVPWQDKRKYDKSKRNNRFRKIVLAKTQAPFNNNQFLMEIHKPEPENNFQILQTPSARTRDSSFSVDSEDNYFYSLPEDEEEYLTKEFSSVYEDAQCERLSNMSKDDLIQEYLLLEAKYENLIKRSERSKSTKGNDEKEIVTDNELSDSAVGKEDEETMVTDRDTSGTSIESSVADNNSIVDIMQRLKDQNEQILELQMENEKLKSENENLRKKSQESSEDSESDSSSTSISCSSSSSSRSSTPAPVQVNGEHQMNGYVEIGDPVEGGEECNETVNGFHNNQQ